MYTIQDVANHAGVSVATVSRVLNNSDKVKPATREAVILAVKELNYRPNLTGRNLRKNETKQIIVILPTIMNTFLAKVVKGVEDTAVENGYSVMICTTYDDYEKEHKHIDMVKNKLADGVIMIGSTLSVSELNDLCREVPVVQCSEYTVGVDVSYVTTDNFKAAFDAVSYMIEGGARRILHLTVDNGFTSSIDRLVGYKAALKAHGIEFDSNLIEYGNYGYRNAFKIVKNRKTDFDGIFAISDRMAAGSISALVSKGVRVPEDVWVVGFDNIDISYISNPSITTVSQKQYEMGKKAVEILIEKLRDSSVNKQILLDYKLIKRQSTASIPDDAFLK